MRNLSAYFELCVPLDLYCFDFHYLCVMDFLNDGYKVKTLNSLQCTGYQIGSILIVLYLSHNDTRGVGTL